LLRHVDGGPKRYRRRLSWRRTARDPEAELAQLRDLTRRGGALPPRGGRRWRRVAKWAAIAVLAWLLLSAALFTVSLARAPGVSADTQAALHGGGFPPFSATTVLVLGSDQRVAGSREPGASTSGPSRSDVMMLIRAGGGHSARLSIPRDTVVDIPGHGTYKINAAYAFGGAALAIRTVESYLGIPIDHVVEINFDNFPKFIDAMGGVTFTNKRCIVSLISGGFRNGGFTLRLAPGTHHLNGKQALALARTRHNLCDPNDSDLKRVARQQQLFQAMKSQLVSVPSFFRLPWIAWNAPPALQTDMGPVTLMGLFAALATNGSPQTRVLTPDGTTTLADGEVGLTVSDAEKRAAVAQFLG
jgi:LCP family protein required for cell wall assembly